MYPSEVAGGSYLVHRVKIANDYIVSARSLLVALVASNATHITLSLFSCECGWSQRR